MFKISWLHLHYDFYRTERIRTIAAQHHFFVCEKSENQNKTCLSLVKMGTKWRKLIKRIHCICLGKFVKTASVHGTSDHSNNFDRDKIGQKSADF